MEARSARSDPLAKGEATATGSQLIYRSRSGGQRPITSDAVSPRSPANGVRHAERLRGGKTRELRRDVQ